MARRKPKFTGRLAEQIEFSRRALDPTWSTIGPYGSEPENLREQEYQRVNREFWEKLPLLFDYYRIPTREDGSQDWRLLAALLAADFVPGLQFVSAGRPEPGAPKIWTVERLLQFFADVETVKRERSCSDSEALHFLTSKRRFAARWKDHKPRTLQNRLIEIRKILREHPEILPSLVPMTFHFRDWLNKNDTSDEQKRDSLPEFNPKPDDADWRTAMTGRLIEIYRIPASQ